MEAKPMVFESEHTLPPGGLARPAAAFPVETEYRQAYAPQPHARIEWTPGTLQCGELPLEPPVALAPDASPMMAAAHMLAHASHQVAVCQGSHFLGAVYADALLECIRGGCRCPATIGALLPGPLHPSPTCAPESTVAAAVDLMLTRALRELPVVDSDGELLGFITLAGAARAGDRDPVVRDELEAAAASSLLFARPWR